jgi:hypothetical protein
METRFYQGSDKKTATEFLPGNAAVSAAGCFGKSKEVTDKEPKRQLVLPIRSRSFLIEAKWDKLVQQSELYI